MISTDSGTRKLVIFEFLHEMRMLRCFFNVFNGDIHQFHCRNIGHVAPLYFHEEDDFYYFNVNYTMHYWIQKGADSRKLVMGIPLYGQSFTLVNPAENGLNAPTSAGGTAGEYTRASGFLAYYEICSKIQREGWTMVKDETGAMGPYAFKGNQWVSFDDVAMVRKKSELIRQLNLGGGMIWGIYRTAFIIIESILTIYHFIYNAFSSFGSG